MTEYAINVTSSGLDVASLSNLKEGDALKVYFPKVSGVSEYAKYWTTENAGTGIVWDPGSFTGLESTQYSYISIVSVAAATSGTISIGISSSTCWSLSVTYQVTTSLPPNTPVMIKERWKNAKPYVRVGTTSSFEWKEVTKAWIKVEGAWRRLNCPVVGPQASECIYFTSTSAFTFSANKTNYLGDPYGTLYYQTNTVSGWQRYTEGTTINMSANSTLYLWNSANKLNEEGWGWWTVSLTGSVSVGGDISSLVNLARDDDAANVSFYRLFKDCTGLTNASNLIIPYSDLSVSTQSDILGELFCGCTNLTSAPALPATTLQTNCYAYMFEGCTSLSSPPSLPATLLDTGCYQGMFYGCISLTTVPVLSATTLTSYCYRYMFYGCTALMITDTNGTFIFTYSTEVSNSVTNMFANTGGSFTGTPVVGDTYYYVKPANCMYLTSASAFTVGFNTAPANMYYSLNGGAWTQYTATVSASANQKIYFWNKDSTLSTSSTQYTFTLTGDDISIVGNISSLLNFSSVSEYCFYKLFSRCSALESASGIVFSSTTAPYCYSDMFYMCTSLTSAPALPAMVLTNRCYNNMFYDCILLTSAPALPATTLANYCYFNMFYECASLTSAPALPATTLAIYCYSYMFMYCSSLTSAPALPATTLASRCYNGMFYGCTELTSAPTLSATTLVSGCYANMFYGCSSLEVNIITGTPIFTYSTEVSGSVTGMFTGTGGDYTTTPVIGNTYYVGTLIDYTRCMYLTSASAFTVGFNAVPSDMCYCIDGGSWTRYTGTVSATAGQKVYFWNTSSALSTSDTQYTFAITGSNVSAVGNTLSLINFSSLSVYCFNGLFENCTVLTSASGLTLSASSLSEACYYRMFYGCTALTSAPSLPATSMAVHCYNRMFYGCTSLISAPSLPATSMAEYCYDSMFQGCTALITPPATLPASTLSRSCYGNMFNGCTALTSAPVMSVSSLAEYSCYCMFFGCSSLKVSTNGGISFLTVPSSIPTEAVMNMFTGTGGIFGGSPSESTTYYTYVYAWEKYNVAVGYEAYCTTSSKYTYVYAGKYMRAMTSQPMITDSLTFDMSSGTEVVGSKTTGLAYRYLASNSDSIKSDSSASGSGFQYPSYYSYLTKSTMVIGGFSMYSDIYAIRSNSMNGMGSYIGIVTGNDSSEYPTFGVQNGYFYMCNSLLFSANTGLTTSGTTTALSGWSTSDYISVNDCTQITISHGNTVSGYACFCEYDSDKTLIDYWGSAENPRTITLTGGTNTKYIRVMFYTANMDSCIFRVNNHALYIFKGKSV